ncbi:threonine/serine exporter family protein [uncultured Methanoregula sp.]|uniref:threonine/serine ThrE exporter family protein n=1 Tax=uncultured Methanoregula sp. TaxID=1005933 RepID=UPI002AAAF8D0|nr:threonine/serine exporter family protein [uncultured Methanoregula sp.]
MTDTGSGNTMKSLPHDSCHFDDSVRFITALIKAIELYGGHSHDICKTVERIIGVLGLHGEILATPNSLIIALWLDEMHRQTVHIATMPETRYDMARLGKLRDLIEEIECGRISPADGLTRIREIERTPSIYGNRLKAFAYLLAGLSFGVLLGLSWLDVLVGGTLGIIAFGVELYVSRFSRVDYARELFIAAFVTFLAGIFDVLLPGINPMAVTVCALSIYIPGFGLTIAPREIVLGDTISGIIYFMKALFVSVKLLLGTFLGLDIAHYLFPVAIADPIPKIDPIFVWVFIPLLLVSMGILYGVLPEDLWLVIGCGLLVWAGVQAGNTFGFWQGTFLGAIVLTLYARIAARRCKIPISTVLLPVILILVPGLGFIQALYMFNTGEVIAGISGVFHEFVIVFAIICGVFVGEILGSWDGIKKQDDGVKES